MRGVRISTIMRMLEQYKRIMWSDKALDLQAMLLIVLLVAALNFA